MSKTKTWGNSTWAFREHPWKFHFLISTYFQYGSSVIEVKKMLENIYMCWEKEIYFLYMWTSKRVKKYPSPPPTHTLHLPPQKPSTTISKIAQNFMAPPLILKVLVDGFFAFR